MTQEPYNITIQLFNHDKGSLDLTSSPPPPPEALSSDDDDYSLELLTPPKIVNSANALHRNCPNNISIDNLGNTMTEEIRPPMMPPLNDFHFDFDHSDLDYSDEESVTSKDPIDDQIISLPTAKTRSLIIDEIDMPRKSKLTVGTVSTSPSASPGHDKAKIEEPYVICSHVQKTNRLTLQTDGSNENTEFPSMTDLLEAIWPLSPTNSAKIKAKNEFGLTVPKTNGSFDYQVKSSILEGWLYKKGTGNDFFRSKSWKPRWCNLVVGSILGHQDEIPMLLVSWHPSMPASTLFILHSRLAIAIDRKEDDSEDSEELFCFDIVAPYAKTRSRENRDDIQNLSRSFSGTPKDRNKWVHKINETVKDCERKLSKARRQKSSLPPTVPSRSSGIALAPLNGLDLVN